MCDGVRVASGMVVGPGVKGGDKASDNSHGERASVDDTLDSLLHRECVISKQVVGSVLIRKCQFNRKTCMYILYATTQLK